ncbi:hypothetical protein DRE_00320 [Drechslerella stenobrocha 248]|uniref:Large ribosomal subunit protein mL40 n=1 Tax=Drechslerella stenobrocha 248 TaxID=1043628 RepID=W7I4G1_9PEZI|nr:hypothetical protein DRE_00320 [Drechslerella stenobrocha 248]
MSISPLHRSVLFSRVHAATTASTTIAAAISPRPSILPSIRNALQSLLPAVQSRSYAKKRKRPQKDPKIRAIDYAFAHPLTPRPLKWSYMRTLRHWTIQQAWLLFKHQQKKERELELERQYNKMHEACEELKRVDERLFRIATDRKGVGTFPAEMRIPTDTPPRDGFNESWRRPKERVVKKGVKRR